MSGQAYDGDEGDAVDDNIQIDAAANPAAMTDLGMTMEDITVDPPGAVAQAIDAVLSILGRLIGISPAQGGQHGIVLGGMIVGAILSPSNLTGMSLAQALAHTNSAVGPTGIISIVGIDLAIGFINPMALSLDYSYHDYTINVNTTTGPTNLDSVATAATVSVEGQSAEMGVISPATWAQITNLNGCAVSRTLPAPMPTGFICSSVGVPLVDTANTVLMFSKQNSFMVPDVIGGTDGLYSLRTAMRLVAPQSPGQQVGGVSIGQYANFGLTYLLLGGTAQGRYVLLASATEALQIVDPSTGAAPVIVAWTWVRVWNGSQQINLCPSLEPAYAFAGAAPNAAAPGFNAADMVSPILALTNLEIQNNVITAAANFAATNPAYNYGGPEGPAG
jgi:hypothetical protein